MRKPLAAYEAKRDFAKTPEPSGAAKAAKPRGKAGVDKSKPLAFVIQKHAARRLHYDFRLELNGVLKSWAVPEGPSLVPGVKRLAVHVEDHPLDYGGFEGIIPEGEYGGGTVMLWDRGTWSPDFDPDFGYAKGHLKFHLAGEKLAGQWHLVRMNKRRGEKQEPWLLFKSDDAAARTADAPDILAEQPLSVASGRTMEAIAGAKARVWSSQSGEVPQPPAPEKKSRAKAAAPKTAAAKSVAGTKAAPLPDFIEPMLPSPVDEPPVGKGWVHEIKYDGYRTQVRIADGKATLLTRKGLDWTHRFGALPKALAKLPVTAALIDGEVVVQSESGNASFTRLVDTLKSGGGTFLYYAFDLMHLDGRDLTPLPLAKRKAALADLVANAGSPHILISEHIEGDGGTIFRHSCRLGLEGIVSKKADAPYRSGRVKSWLKARCAMSGHFVVAGFMPSSLDAKAVGALVLGEHVGGTLVPSGHVGTGFTAETARALFAMLDALRTKTPPLKDATADAKRVRWVEPTLVAEVEYRSRTGGELIRHASFKGLAEDRDASEVVRPTEPQPSAPKAPLKDSAVRLTNPSRILWPDAGITKEGLADFYTEIAGWILPHIADRPLSLVRCPGGIAAQCFFQKHKWAGLGGAVRLVPVPGDDEPMLAIDGLDGLMELVQASVLEIHPWGARAGAPERADRITIDLDPGDDVPWEHVVEAARDVRARLEALGLAAFLKTTGGKGLHVVVPLAPTAPWDSAKAFAQALAGAMARERPDRYLDTMAKAQRRGRIYVDYLRNGMGATAVAAYSTRARPGAAVSTPLAWTELGPDIRPAHFTVENLPTRLRFLDRDPWAGIDAVKQALPKGAEGGAKAKGRARAKPVAKESAAPAKITRKRKPPPTPSP